LDLDLDLQSQYPSLGLINLLGQKYRYIDSLFINQCNPLILKARCKFTYEYDSFHVLKTSLMSKKLLSPIGLPKDWVGT
jgi:hypothetical protein